MNKYLRGCLILLLVMVLLVAGITGWYYWKKDNNQKQAQADFINFSRICDTLSLITEKPSIELHSFTKGEVDRLKFYLIRKGKILRDTAIQNQITSADSNLYISLPFDQFLKTDTIVLETLGKVKRYYSISGFRHYAYLHYGMMGYLGGYDCRFDNDNIYINGKKSDGNILKRDGMLKNVLP